MLLQTLRLQSPMWNSAFNSAPCLAWNNIRNVNICCFSLNVSVLRDFFELHCGPQGFQSCKNTNYNGAQLPGCRSFFKRAFEITANSKELLLWGTALWLTAHSDLCEEGAFVPTKCVRVSHQSKMSSCQESLCNVLQPSNEMATSWSVTL